MKQLTSLAIVLAVLVVLPALARDKDKTPRGFLPFSELKEAQAKAEKDKKLLVLVVKGDDDQCPNCAAALANGLSAVGSSVVKVFVRVDAIREADASGLSKALQERMKKQFIGGAYVTFVVFKPDMSEIVVEAGRKELQNDKKAIAAFKKEVTAAKKALKTISAPASSSSEKKE